MKTETEIKDNVVSQFAEGTKMLRVAETIQNGFEGVAIQLRTNSGESLQEIHFKPETMAIFLLSFRQLLLSKEITFDEYIAEHCPKQGFSCTTEINGELTTGTISVTRLEGGKPVLF